VKEILDFKATQDGGGPSSTRRTSELSTCDPLTAMLERLHETIRPLKRCRFFPTNDAGRRPMTMAGGGGTAQALRRFNVHQANLIMGATSDVRARGQCVTQSRHNRIFNITGEELVYYSMTQSF